MRPDILVRFVLRLVPRSHREYVAGDLEEGYAERAALQGPARARLWLWRQAVKTLAAFLAPARWAGGWASDARRAGRTLARSPGYAAASVVTLALGIGAVTAMFTVLEQVVLRPLAVRDQAGIVVAWNHHTVRNFPHFPFAWPVYEAVQRGVPSLADVAATDNWGPADRIVEVREGEEEVLKVSRVAGDYFGVLGVAPVMGRTLRPEDDTPGAERVAVLSHGAWTRHYGASPDAVGSVLWVQGERYRVVGILAAGFDYPRDSEVWVALRPFYANWAEETPHLELDLVARLRPGASKERVAEEIARVYRTIPEAMQRTYEGAVPVVKGFDEVILGDLRATLVLLFAGALLVLLVACVNVANLVEVRAAGREATVAVRRALGASRWRLIRESLAEAAWLGVLGGSGGAVVATLAIRFLVPLAPAGLARIDQVTPPDALALLVSGTVTMAVVVLIAVLPVLRTGKVDPARALRGAGRSTVGVGKRRGGIVVAQAALAVWSAAVGVLLLRSLLELQGLDLGFRVEHVTLVSLDMSSAYAPGAGYWPEDFPQRLEQIDARVEAHPAIEAVTAVSVPPLMGPQAMAFPPVLEGQTPEQAFEDNPYVNFELVQPDYFRTLQLPLVRGRPLSTTDRERALPVAIVNEAAARLLWPAEEALGKRLLAFFGEERWWTVVGVVANARYQDLVETRPVVYFPLSQFTMFLAPSTLLVRSAAGIETLLTTVRDAVAETDPAIRVKEATSLRAHLEAPLARPRFAVLILGTLAATTLLLAAVGVYGVMAAAVRARTAEIGVRLACGATPMSVRSLILRHGMLLASAGVVIGGAAVIAAGSLLESLLFKVPPSDPRSLAGGAVLVLAVALLAGWVPAARAARLDPARVLRAE